MVMLAKSATIFWLTGQNVADMSPAFPMKKGSLTRTREILMIFSGINLVLRKYLNSLSKIKVE
jgi:hypothetical protein